MLNQIILQANLTKEPEARATKSGKQVVQLSVACNRDFKQEGQPSVDYFNVICFGATGEFVQKYFKKGQQALIVGSVQNRSWDGKDGAKHYATDIIAKEVKFAGTNQNKSGGSSNGVPFESAEETPW